MRNILIVGETGVGKSSMVNLIRGRKDAAVSGSAASVTFEAKKYPFENLQLIDTVGYNDAKEKNSKEPLKKLEKLAKELARDGIALIVYVMKNGRLNASSKQAYQFFVNHICEKKVPVLLVVTGCEEARSGYDWYAEQRKTFEDAEMNFHDTVCGCTMDLEDPALDPDLIPFYKNKQVRTHEQITEKIRKHALEQPWKPFNFVDWIEKIFIQVINVFGIPEVVVAEFATKASIKIIKSIKGPK